MTDLDPDRIRRPSGLGARVLVYRETASTNDVALKLGEQGEPEGTVVIADSQSRGRGRFQRPWHSEPGLGLWMSVLLRPNRPFGDWLGLTPVVAVAVARAIADVSPAVIRIKPPNDIHGKKGKLAGILIETRSGPNSFAVVGIGINIHHHHDAFPPELRTTASSLLIESGTAPDRSLMATRVLTHLATAYTSDWNLDAAYADLTKA